MAHIPLPEGLPGILGPMAFRPETAKPLNELAEALLRGPSPLPRGERELIAAYVSSLNECHFWTQSHGAFALLQLKDGRAVVEAVKRDPETAPVSEKLKSLLRIAAKVRADGRSVTAADVAAARGKGATDVEIHDAVLIAAAFSMYNRYVDGLATWAPDDPRAYEEIGKRIVAHGYTAAPPPPAR